MSREKTSGLHETHRRTPAESVHRSVAHQQIAATTRSDIAASRKIESPAGMGLRWGLAATTLGTGGAIIVNGSIDVG